ncbi:MAG: serine hydrolase [Bacteroidia bacterium]
MKRKILYFIVAFAPKLVFPDNGLLESILSKNTAYEKVIKNLSKYQPQIIYTQIDRNSNNNPVFTDFYYNVDTNRYFYCASLVKLPCSIFALEKINETAKGRYDRKSYMLTEKTLPCQKRCTKDAHTLSGYPSIESHVSKMLLISDNESYSRIYEYLTPTFINNKLKHYGYSNARIVHRFDPICKKEISSVMNPILFKNEKMELLYKREAVTDNYLNTPPFKNVVLGKDVIKNGKLISEKKDFTYNNYISLPDIHSILTKLIFHSHFNKEEQFNINKEDWGFLMKLLGAYPREINSLKLDTKEFFDAYKKYFIYGNSKSPVDNENIRIFNIVGYSYGFMIDCAYVVDFSNKTEFLLSTILYTNERNSFGSGLYEYNSVTLPFMKQLGLDISDYERNRTRIRKPNLDEFNLYGFKDDTTKKLPKLVVRGVVTVNEKPTNASVVIKSINKNYSYYPETASERSTGSFIINLLAGEDYEIEVNVPDMPPQVIDLKTKNFKDKDTINIYPEFVSPHFDKIIKTKQDSLFLEMIKAYNSKTALTFGELYSDKRINGLKFKVQIGAYRIIENFNYTSLSEMPMIIRESFDDNVTRFTMGNYEIYSEAKNLMDKIKERGIKDAFIIAVFEGKRYYLNELIEKQIIK